MDPNDFKPLIEILERTKVPICTQRKNSGEGKTQPFGFINRRIRGVGPARQNQKYPELYEAIKQISYKIKPDHNYTAFQLNVNYTAKPHIDKNNFGESTTVSFGDFTGGELVINDQEINTRYNPHTFEAFHTLHSVNPILSGTRYSLVLFRPKYYRDFLDTYGDDIFLSDMELLIQSRKHMRYSDIRLV